MQGSKKLFLCCVVFVTVSITTIHFHRCRKQPFLQLFLLRTRIPLEDLPRISELSHTEIFGRNLDTPEKAPAFQDESVRKSGCPLGESKRQWQYKLMKWWLKLAAEHHIYWFLTAGTLLGALRHNDTIPMDGDADLGVFDIDVPKLLSLQTPVDKIDMKKINLVCRPGKFCKVDGDHNERRTCKGALVSKKVDECSFCSPICRVITSAFYLDLWFFGIERSNQSAYKVYDESKSEYRKTKFYDKVDTILPLKECSYMGLTLLCPQQIRKYLMPVYKNNLKPLKHCVNKTWVKK